MLHFEITVIEKTLYFFLSYLLFQLILIFFIYFIIIASSNYHSLFFLKKISQQYMYPKALTTVPRNYPLITILYIGYNNHVFDTTYAYLTEEDSPFKTLKFVLKRTLKFTILGFKNMPKIFWYIILDMVTFKFEHTNNFFLEIFFRGKDIRKIFYIDGKWCVNGKPTIRQLADAVYDLKIPDSNKKCILSNLNELNLLAKVYDYQLRGQVGVYKNGITTISHSCLHSILQDPKQTMLQTGLVSAKNKNLLNRREFVIEEYLGPDKMSTGLLIDKHELRLSGISWFPYKNLVSGAVKSSYVESIVTQGFNKDVKKLKSVLDTIVVNLDLTNSDSTKLRFKKDILNFLD